MDPMQYRQPNAYQGVSNANNFGSVSDSQGRQAAASQCMACDFISIMYIITMINSINEFTFSVILGEFQTDTTGDCSEYQQAVFDSTQIDMPVYPIRRQYVILRSYISQQRYRATFSIGTLLIDTTQMSGGKQWRAVIFG